MPYFEGASEFEINGGQFNVIHGNVYNYSGQHADSSQALCKLVEKDAALNQYCVENGTLKIPHFSKTLLLQDLPIDFDAGRIGAGSCSFDLLARLGLSPGQDNEALAEYDADVPFDAVVSRKSCYCGRISRHGLIFLVSKYFQYASVEKATGGGTCIILSTTIGRFKCYEIEDHTFIHFDSSLRSSYIDIIEDQKLDEILRTAQGQYLINFAPNGSRQRSWARAIDRADREVERLATLNVFDTPNAIMYMTKDTMQWWMQLNIFAKTVIETTLDVLGGLQEPATFTTALNNLPNLGALGDPGLALNAATSTPPTKLAYCVMFWRDLSKKRLTNMPFKMFDDMVCILIADVAAAHRHFRSPRVEVDRLLTTSQDRFLHLLKEVKPVDNVRSDISIQEELQNLLQSNKNNVALVVLQGLLGMISLWNSSRVLSRAREAPAEWIRFVGADDDEVFIG